MTAKTTNVTTERNFRAPQSKDSFSKAEKTTKASPKTKSTTLKGVVKVKSPKKNDTVSKNKKSSSSSTKLKGAKTVKNGIPAKTRGSTRKVANVLTSPPAKMPSAKELWKSFLSLFSGFSAASSQQFEAQLSELLRSEGNGEGLLSSSGPKGKGSKARQSSAKKS